MAVEFQTAERDNVDLLPQHQPSLPRCGRVTDASQDALEVSGIMRSHGEVHVLGGAAWKAHLAKVQAEVTRGRADDNPFTQTGPSESTRASSTGPGTGRSLSVKGAKVRIMLSQVVGGLERTIVAIAQQIAVDQHRRHQTGQGRRQIVPPEALP